MFYCRNQLKYKDNMGLFNSWICEFHATKSALWNNVIIYQSPFCFFTY